MEPPGIIVAFLLLGLLLWLWAASLDRGRIAKYVQERGGRVISITWSPFGKGWFGEKGDRLYEVVYYDRKGDQHFATCKTSLLSGVYWTDDRVSHHTPEMTDEAAGVGPSSPDDHHRLRQENERLREELARLRREHEEQARRRV